MKPSAERPLGELFTELANETGTLVRQEVNLAKTEMTEKAVTAAKQSAVLGAGGALLHVAVISLAGAAVAALAMLMQLWLAALIVGVVVMGLGFALVQTGLAGLRRINPVPVATVRTLKENQLWAKRELSR